VIVQDVDLSFLDDNKVPVILGVMSRCPDALICESVFDQVIQRTKDKAQYSMSYVAKIDSSDPTFGVDCMHGEDECAGNVQQLCAKKYAPDQWWDFVQCQNYQGRNKIGLPDVALKCAKAAGFDWELSGVGRCAGLDGSGTGKEGIALLQASVRASEKLGLEKSCTVMINYKKVCVHDSTWRECEDGHAPGDFVRQINSEYEKINGD